MDPELSQQIFKIFTQNVSLGSAGKSRLNHQWYLPGKRAVCCILIGAQFISPQSSNVNSISSLPSKIMFEK